MMKPNCLIAFFLALILSLEPSISLAHEGATGIVKERMEAMKDISGRMKSIAKMIKGEEAYDAERLAKLATEIGIHGGEAMIAKFPEGSIHGPSEAIPAIWEDWDEFKSLAFELSRLSNALVAETKTNPGEPAEETFRALAKNCKSCHDDFREKK